MRLSLPRLKMPRLPGFSILVWISTALKGWVMGSREKDTDSLIMYDRTLLWLTFGLAAIGFIMVTSASMPIGQRLTNDPFFFAKRDGVYLILAFILAIITLRLPMEFWQRYSATMLLGSIILLMIVLVVGSSVKGASRWIDLGLLRIQPAELTKLSLFCYIANYLVRKGDEVRRYLPDILAYRSDSDSPDNAGLPAWPAPSSIRGLPLRGGYGCGIPHPAHSFLHGGYPYVPYFFCFYAVLLSTVRHDGQRSVLLLSFVYCGFVISFQYLYKHRGASASHRNLLGEHRIPVRPHRRTSSFLRP